MCRVLRLSVLTISSVRRFMFMAEKVWSFLLAFIKLAIDVDVTRGWLPKENDVMFCDERNECRKLEVRQERSECRRKQSDRNRGPTEE